MLIWTDDPTGAGEMGPRPAVMRELCRNGPRPAIMVQERHFNTSTGPDYRKLQDRVATVSQAIPAWWPGMVHLCVDYESSRYGTIVGAERTTESMAADAMACASCIDAVRRGWRDSRQVLVSMYGRPYRPDLSTMRVDDPAVMCRLASQCAGVVNADAVNISLYHEAGWTRADTAWRWDALATAARGVADGIGAHPMPLVVNWTPWRFHSRFDDRPDALTLKGKPGFVGFRAGVRRLPGFIPALWMAPRWRRWLELGWPADPRESAALELEIGRDAAIAWLR